MADDFDAELGDIFTLLTSTRGFTGSFDAYDGFDLDANKAFKLIAQDENTYALQVTTDMDANAFIADDGIL